MLLVKSLGLTQPLRLWPLLLALSPSGVPPPVSYSLSARRAWCVVENQCCLCWAEAMTGTCGSLPLLFFLPLLVLFIIILPLQKL